MPQPRSLPGILLLPALLAAPLEPIPRLRIEPAGRVELGSLGPREGRAQAYRLRNASPRPIALRILDLAPGVTVAGPALAAPIPAGASAALTLRLEPEGWTGVQDRTVRLGTDDARQGDYFLPVRAEIRPDLTVDGVRREFGRVGEQESPCQWFLFRRETGEPLWLHITSPLPPYLEAELQSAGAVARLGLTLRPERIPAGMRLGLERVRVETNAPLQPGFDLYLGWRLRLAVEPEPARVLFQGPGERTRTLTLKASDGAPFRILAAVVAGGAFTVGPLPEPARPVQTLEIRRAGAAPARAMLVLTVQGQDHALQVPLASLP